MNRPVQRRRQADRARPAEHPNRYTTRSGRSAVFVAWDGYPAEAARSPWPVNEAPPRGGTDIGVGHRHLCRLLLLHDTLTYQGVVRASGMLSEYEIADALDACAYFDLPDLAATLAEIPMAASSSAAARVFDAEYQRLFATTDRLMDAIAEQIATHPDDFPGSDAGS
jgi:hypothetical protein